MAFYFRRRPENARRSSNGIRFVDTPGRIQPRTEWQARDMARMKSKYADRAIRRGEAQKAMRWLFGIKPNAIVIACESGKPLPPMGLVTFEPPCGYRSLWLWL